jgi:hypothetical protein
LAMGSEQGGNADVLGDLLASDEWKVVEVAGTRRGLLMSRQVSMIEVATVLERLRYEHHAPDPRGRHHKRWQSLAAQMNLASPEAPLFRPPTPAGPHQEAVSPNSCPYSIAAYLRLWNAALTRKVRGLYPTDDYRTPWPLINRTDYAATAPAFNVGVRFGEAGTPTDKRLANHGVECMIRSHKDGVVLATWGSRNPGEGTGRYLGDHLFDYHNTDQTPPRNAHGEQRWRSRGEPGLLLFHVVKVGDGESVTAGLALPIGGPDHFAALSPGVRSERSQ